MQYPRSDRLKELLRQTVSEIIQRDLQDPRLEMATVTDVEVSADLRHATVYMSVVGPPERNSQMLSAVDKASGHIRSEVGRRVRLKYLPDIAFAIDPSIEEGMKIESLLSKLKSEEAERADE